MISWCSASPIYSAANVLAIRDQELTVVVGAHFALNPIEYICDLFPQSKMPMKRQRINPNDSYFKRLASHEFVIELDSGVPGPTSCIAGFVHGNEQAGFFAFQELEKLTIDRGKVYLVGGNPAALLADVRFVSENLNRMHGDENDQQVRDKLDTYERAEALRIMSVLQKSDALFDIHQSRDSVNFIICEPHSSDLAKQFDVQWVIMGLDKFHPGGTDGYMNTLTKSDSSLKNGLCLEAGDMNDDDQSENLAFAVREATRFISIRGHIDSLPGIPASQRKPTTVQVFDEYIISSHITFDYSPSSFDRLQLGQLIATDGDKQILCPKKWDGCYLIFPEKCPDTPVGKQGFLVAKQVD